MIAALDARGSLRITKRDAQRVYRVLNGLYDAGHARMEAAQDETQWHQALGLEMMRLGLRGEPRIWYRDDSGTMLVLLMSPGHGAQMLLHPKKGLIFYECLAAAP